MGRPVSRRCPALSGFVGSALILCLLAAVPAMLLAQEAGNADAAPGGDEPPGLEAAAWLAGCWEARSADGTNTVEEQWMAPRGGLMLGLSRTVRDGRVRGHEFLSIREAGGPLVYHAVPSGQSPTNFPARSVEDDRLEFVNPVHDFPRKIVYSRTAPDSIRAMVFAEVEDDEPAFALPYGRIPCPGS